MARFSPVFSSAASFQPGFFGSTSFSPRFTSVIAVEKDAVVYQGETTVVPKIGQDVTLPTQNKKLLSDVTVKEVPLFRTSNETGNTLYIGRKM